MKITLGSNIASLQAQRRLGDASGQMAKTFERLSSGMRINRASDDAAGLSIADSLRTDARVYNQALRNVSDGISLLSIADGAIQELSKITTRLSELAEQAANGVYSPTQRKALDTEAQALSKEFTRIVVSTEFNNLGLLNGEVQGIRIQAGYGELGSILSGVGGAIGTGDFSLASTIAMGSSPFSLTSGDVNQDGLLDLVAPTLFGGTYEILLGVEGGGFASGGSAGSSFWPTATALIDVDGDTQLDIVAAVTDLGTSRVDILTGNGDGTFNSPTTYTGVNNPASIATGDFDGDGSMDFVIGNGNNSDISIFMNDGAGDFGSTTLGVGGNVADVQTGDVNGDGVLDILASTDAIEVAVMLGNGDGTFQAYTPYTGTGAIGTGDFNNDGNLDFVSHSGAGSDASVYLGQGDGTFGAAQNVGIGAGLTDLEVGDFNGDGNLDFVSTDSADDTVSVLLGNGDGTFATRNVVSLAGGTPSTLVTGDFTGDGVLDLVTANYGDGTLSFLTGTSVDGVGPLLDFSLQNTPDARFALTMFQRKLEQLAGQRGEIGAFQSRLSIAANNLSSLRENSLAAESRIRDTDIAEESSELVRLSILQQAGAAVLAQANQQPSLALSLLSS